MPPIVLLLLSGSFLLFLAVLIGRALLLRTPHHEGQPFEGSIDVDAAAGRLAAALRVRTDPENATTGFGAMHRLLRESFPLVHRRLEREVVADKSLLFTWRGEDPDRLPVLLMGHMDVVPVEEGTEKDWTWPPFSGQIAGGYIWGRGAMDNKLGVLGALEAVEMLLREDFRPKRSVLLAFGHDEEEGGQEGAMSIAALLASRGIRLHSVLDEGLVVIEGLLPEIPRPLALVGIAEKGCLSLELRARSEGGHSSLPPPESAIGILSRAVVRLEEHPMPVRWKGAATTMFLRLAPELPLLVRIACANLWCFRRLVARKLKKQAATNALMRTTTAPTVFQSGLKDNVLPQHARAVVNFRIHSEDSVARVTEHVRRTIADDRVEIRRLPTSFDSEPSPTTSTELTSYRLFEDTVRQVFPDALVAPSLLVGATDSRHYQHLTEATFRFLPLRVSPDDRTRVHGTDERLRVESYGDVICFYRRWIENACV